MPELDAERRERLAEALYDEGRVWLTPMQQALVVEHLAPLVAGWLAEAEAGALRDLAAGIESQLPEMSFRDAEMYARISDFITRRADRAGEGA